MVANCIILPLLFIFPLETTNEVLKTNQWNNVSVQLDPPIILRQKCRILVKNAKKNFIVYAFDSREKALARGHFIMNNGTVSVLCQDSNKAIPSKSTDIKEIRMMGKNYIVLYFAFFNDTFTVLNSNSGTECNYSAQMLKITRVAVDSNDNIVCDEMEQLCQNDE